MWIKIREVILFGALAIVIFAIAFVLYPVIGGL